MSHPGFSLRDYFREIFEYDAWANRQTIEALAAISPLPEEALHRMSHVVICQGLWLNRIAGQEINSYPTLFPKWSLDETRSQQEHFAAEVLRVVEELPEERFHQPLTFVATDGGRYSILHFECLTQLALHGSYHRGQIGITVNRLGGKPLDLDFGYYKRKKVSRG